MNPTTLAATLAQMLEARGWTSVEPTERFERLAPPQDLGLSEDFSVVVPRDPTAIGGLELLSRTVRLISEVYGLDPEDMLVTLGEDSTIFSTTVADEEAESGKLPLDRFESLVDRLRGICASAATSLVVEDPLEEEEPPDVSAYVRRCSFLQTRVGSFQCRVQLPNTLQLGRNLLRPEGIPSRAAASRIHDALSLVFTDVVDRSNDIYQRDFLEANQDLLHLPLIRNISRMLDETQFREFQFSFTAVERKVDISTPRLTARDRRHVADYVAFLRDHLRSGIAIDAVGKVTELRSKDVKSSNNHVRVVAMDQGLGREIDLALSLGRASYLDAVDAHRAGKRVHIVGTARRLKSYYRVDG